MLKLIKQFINIFNSKTTLFLNYSNFEIFEGISECVTNTISKNEEVFSEKGLFDLIVGDLPMGMMKKEWLDKDKQIKIKSRENWIDLFKSLFLLDTSGYGIYLVEPVNWSEEWRKFQTQLKNKGFYVNAILNSPYGILQPQTSLQPHLIIVSKKKYPRLFIAELDKMENFLVILHNFKSLNDSGNIDTGLFVNEEDFKGFSIFKASKEIDALETQYKNYKKYQMKDIVIEIISGSSKSNFEDKTNALYLPKIGNSLAVINKKQLKIKEQNCFQIVLNEKIVRSKYIEQFFKSKLGKLTLKTLSLGTIISQISKKNLLEAYLPIPDFKEQENLIKTVEQLNQLQEKIEVFGNEIALNPKSAYQIQDKLNNKLLALDELTEVDKLHAIVRMGESKTVEFKQTLSVDVNTDKKEKFIEKMVMKTIVAFLNTDGGILLIGVGDDKSIIGVQGEIEKFYKNDDKFLLHFKNIIKTSIGENFYPFIDYWIIDFLGNKILKVDCKESLEPCYFESREFYVRTNPSTDKLEGPKMVEYIKSHFKKN